MANRDENVKHLDAGALKALAHPLRVELFRALREEPATASQLAERFGETSASTSYHLRQLARFGFIEDDPERGNRRDRWWKAAVRGIDLDLRDEGIGDDPATAELARWYVRDAVQQQWDRAHQFIAHTDDWDHDWMGASTFSDFGMDLTPAQLEALRDELIEVARRHTVEPGTNPDPTARRVRVTLHAFPEGLPDSLGSGDAREAAHTSPEADPGSR